MKTTIALRGRESQKMAATPKMRIHGAAILLATMAAAVAFAPNARAQGVSHGPCYSGVDCIVGTIAAAPNPVVVGTNLTLTTDTKKFMFTAATVVWVTPMNGGFSRGNLVSLVVLCGPMGGVALPGGKSIPGGKVTCTPNPGGASMTIFIPAGLIGNQLIQKGTPAPAGYWNLFALNPAMLSPFMKFAPPILEAPLPYLIHFVPTMTAPAGPPPPPFVSNVAPGCFAAAPTTITASVDGQNFEPGAHVIVSYIYYVEPNGVFRTDWYGRDSRTAAIMLQQSSTYLEFSIDVQQIHETAGDNFTNSGGNYYVQVQNPDGQVSGGPMYFTVKPYYGYGHC